MILNIRMTSANIKDLLIFFIAFTPAINVEGRINIEGNIVVLLSQLNEYRNAIETLREQLSELNLFNAKLLYVNKLMQNRGLSDKQLRTVVEALDAASTIREAKLLYTSLSESLSRSAGSLSESSTRTAGGASRPTRSSSRTESSPPRAPTRR